MGLQTRALKDPPSDIKRILSVLLFKLCFSCPVKIIFVRTQVEVCIDFNMRIYIFSTQAKEQRGSIMLLPNLGLPPTWIIK